jgi:DNA-binding transcriptional regulator of glucitol operon
MEYRKDFFAEMLLGVVQGSNPGYFRSHAVVAVVTTRDITIRNKGMQQAKSGALVETTFGRQFRQRPFRGADIERAE